MYLPWRILVRYSPTCALIILVLCIAHALFYVSIQTTRELQSAEIKPMGKVLSPHWGEKRLVLAVDDKGSCPCPISHMYLPPSLTYRYASFSSPNELEEMIQETHHEGTHYLITARGDPTPYGRIAQQWKTVQNHTVSFGFFHMADELLDVPRPYHMFDYVFRHYYSHGSKRIPHLRALGNLTCGGYSPPLPVSAEADTDQTRLGVHWTFVLDGPKPFHYRWPMDRRTRNCTFIGRSTGPREEMKKILTEALPPGICDIQFTSGFRKGHDLFKYTTSDMADSKIVLNPTGNNVECIRLGEMLPFGTIPAMVHAPYVHATWKPQPGIVRNSWQEVADEIRRLLLQENAKELEGMSLQAHAWWDEYITCMQQDVAHILSLAVFQKGSTSKGASYR